MIEELSPRLDPSLARDSRTEKREGPKHGLLSHLHLPNHQTPIPSPLTRPRHPHSTPFLSIPSLISLSVIQSQFNSQFQSPSKPHPASANVPQSQPRNGVPLTRALSEHVMPKASNNAVLLQVAGRTVLCISVPYGSVRSCMSFVGPVNQWGLGIVVRG
jgi:hypothetical protein